VAEEDIIKENKKFPWGFDPKKIKEGDYIYIPLDKKQSETHSRPQQVTQKPETQSQPKEEHSRNPPRSEETELASLKKKEDNNLKPPKPQKIPKPETKVKTEFIWPVDGEIISQFGQRGNREHKGIDIKAPEGTPIKAAADGVVIFSGFLKGYGNVVIIKHEGDFFTVYAHNKLNTVKEGDFVKKGQEIGKVGMTGNASTPHLHFEIRRRTQALNPLIFLPEKELSKTSY
ncbi:MAG: M23 family metallopeptidase, partial [Brevinematales bacterium]